MKNRHNMILLFVTGLALAFMLGFLVGRTSRNTPVQISRVPEVTISDRALAVSRTPAESTQTQPSTHPVTETVTQPSESVYETSPATQPAVEDSRININTATLAQLDSLPGIGEVLAQRIIDYREAHGPFTAVSQLTLVEGIGSKRLAAILDLITVE